MRILKLIIPLFFISCSIYSYEQYNEYFKISVNFKNKKEIIIKIIPLEDYKLNRNFPSKIFLKGKNIKFNNMSQRKYTRNEFKKFFESILVLKDSIDVSGKIFFLNLSGSIGICSEEFCKKIDINKNFKIKTGGALWYTKYFHW